MTEQIIKNPKACSLIVVYILTSIWVGSRKMGWPAAYVYRNELIVYVDSFLIKVETEVGSMRFD